MVTQQTGVGAHTLPCFGKHTLQGMGGGKGRGNPIPTRAVSPWVALRAQQGQSLGCA